MKNSKKYVVGGVLSTLPKFETRIIRYYPHRLPATWAKQRESRIRRSITPPGPGPLKSPFLRNNADAISRTSAVHTTYCTWYQATFFQETPEKR